MALSDRRCVNWDCSALHGHNNCTQHPTNNVMANTICIKSCHLKFQLTMYSVLIMAFVSIAWTQEIPVAPYKKLFVDLHNQYRRQEGSSNMQEMVCIVTNCYKRSSCS